MNKILEVHDNIVPFFIQNYIDTFIHNSHYNLEEESFPLYYVGSITNADKNISEPGLSHEFLSPGYHALDFCGGLLQPLFLLSLFREFNIQRVLQARVFLQTPSGKSSIQQPHTDRSSPHYVCLYYVNDGDGDTVFFDNTEKEIKRVSPKKGRIVFFDGSIIHAGSTPTSKTRTVVNIGFTIAKN